MTADGAEQQSKRLPPLPPLVVRRRRSNGGMAGRDVTVRPADRQRPPMVLTDLTALTLQRRREARTVLSPHRPNVALPDLDVLEVRGRSTGYIPPESASAGTEVTPNHERGRVTHDAGYAAVELDLGVALGAGAVPPDGRGTDVVALVAVGFVAAARSDALRAGTPIDLEVQLPAGADRLLRDADRHTVVSLGAALMGATASDAARASSHLLGFTHSGHWGILSSAAPLRSGCVMSLDLGVVSRAVGCDLAANGSEVFVRRTTATASLTYAVDAIDTTAAHRLLADLRALLSDSEWLVRQLRGHTPPRAFQEGSR